MNEERSAGFVVFHRSDGGSPARFLLLDYGSHWDFPKGHVEAGESDLEAARRELWEETGLREVSVVPGFVREIEYHFRRDGMLTQKRVVFFLAETASEMVVLSEEHVGYRWLEVDAAIKRLRYATAREVLRRAVEVLNGSAGGDDAGRT